MERNVDYPDSQQRKQRRLEEEEYSPLEIEEQAGFRAGRSCLDHIFSLVRLNEKKVARNRETYLLFVDLTKAYDTVPGQKLCQVLERSRINVTLIVSVRLYDHSTSKIKLKNKISDSFPVTKGCLSSTLFKIYLNDGAMEKIM